MKQISIVFEIFDNEELQFLGEIYDFAKEMRKKNKSNHPKVVGTHIKLINEEGGRKI